MRTYLILILAIFPVSIFGQSKILSRSNSIKVNEGSKFLINEFAYKSQPVDLDRPNFVISSPGWDSLTFDWNLKIFASGEFSFVGYDNLLKNGQLSPSDFSQLKNLVSKIPLKDTTIQGYIPHDGKTYQTSIFHPTGLYKYSISHGKEAKNITDLSRFLAAYNDSLAQSIIKLDSQWVDLDRLNCLFWYKGEIIPWQELPFKYIQWGGKKLHRLYVLAEKGEEVLAETDLDYVIYVDEIGPNENWSNLKGETIPHPMISKKRKRKKELKKILRAYEINAEAEKR